MNTDIKRISKFLSLVLRHDPSVAGITLDKNGWADVEDLIEGVKRKGVDLNFATLQEVVITNNKKRFAFSDDMRKIRASQGHSVAVDVELKEEKPPQILYHGTVAKYLDLIYAGGLKKMTRQHVHLSHERETANSVASRRGKPVILKVDATRMHSEGIIFFKSQNGVWLVDYVDPKYIIE